MWHNHSTCVGIGAALCLIHLPFFRSMPASLTKVEGDPKVEMELATALREKTASFCVRDLPSMAFIMDAHNSKSTLGNATSADITNIQQDAFDLVMRQLDYDTKAYRVWMGKMGNYNSALPTKVSGFCSGANSACCGIRSYCWLLTN